MARPRSHHQRHQLRGLVLNQEVARGRHRRPQRVAVDDRQAIGRHACRHGLDAKRAEVARRSPHASARVRFTRSVSGASTLLKATHALAASSPSRSIHRATSHRGCEPAMWSASMARSRSPGERIAAGSGRQGQPIARARDRPQHAVDETARAGLAPSPHQRHRVVDHGRGGHALEEEQLEQAQAQDLEDDARRACRGCADRLLQVEVEPRAPPQRADDDRGGQRAVALVGQLVARAREHVGQVRRPPTRSTARRAPPGVRARSSQDGAGRDRVAGKKLARRHRALALRFHGQQLHRAMAGRDDEAVAACGEHRARQRAGRRCLGAGVGGHHQQARAVERRWRPAATGSARAPGCGSRRPAATRRSAHPPS